MQPEVNYTLIGKRIRIARTEKNMSQAELGQLVGCSNNHMSHIETGQTKVSLTMLLQIAFALGKNLDYFLSDTPFVGRDSLVNNDISAKIARCEMTTLVALNKILDILLEQQEYYKRILWE